MYRNSEGYPDKTAGTALANIEREEKEEKRKINAKRQCRNLKQVSK